MHVGALCHADVLGICSVGVDKDVQAGAVGLGEHMWTGARGQCLAGVLVGAEMLGEWEGLCGYQHKQRVLCLWSGETGQGETRWVTCIQKANGFEVK